jgi:RNA polymerase sigma-70 factor (ECF subfamily)
VESNEKPLDLNKTRPRPFDDVFSMSELSLSASDHYSGKIEWPMELEKHKPWLLKVLRCRIGNRHEVEDLYQNLAVQVLRQVDPKDESKTASVPEDPEKIAPWLYRIAIRQAVNFHRQMNRRSQAHPTDELNPEDAQPEPLQWLIDQEETESIQQSIESMRAQDREILTLKYVENWTYQQLSDHLGVPVGSIEYRLAQARKRLRTSLTRISID